MTSKPASPVEIDRPVELDWKVGFEIELMAPAGVSRRDLAERVAQRVGGSAMRFFHPESEPAKVPGHDVFENLTPGFTVVSGEGEWVASFVDDLTLQADFHREAKPKPGWYRIVSDDRRFLRLVEQQCDPAEPLETVLDPVAALFGTETDMHPGGMRRVNDANGASIAVGAPLPGERERPCEIVTAPIEADHHTALSALLDDAAALGFSLPRESATHIHFDARPLRSAHFMARFVTLIDRFGGDLRTMVNANPNCTRLGGWPPELAQAVARPNFATFDWDEVRATLIGLKLVKYCDFNLVNMVNQEPAKDTLEVRILPGMTDTRDILLCAALFESILRWCNEQDGPLPDTVEALLKVIPLSDDLRKHWIHTVN
ncbi:MAG: amidoligase family protein [Pseudomonadota bacterium]